MFPLGCHLIIELHFQEMYHNMIYNYEEVED